MTAASPRGAWLRAYEAAHQAAARGFHTFPIGRAKLPAIRSPHRDDTAGAPSCRGACGRPGHGVHDATTDPKRLDELFDAAPYATGYGIACGRGTDPLLGVDLDRKHEGVDGVASLASLAEQHGFTVPDTTVVATPSGGLHLWFVGPAGAPVRNSAGKLAPGIDVRGYGGYLVGPGSWTPKGIYQFVERRPAAELPDALLPLMLPAPEPRRAPVYVPGPRRGAALVGLVKFVLEAPEGELNNRLYWAACRAFETGVDADSIGRALVEAAVSLGHPERAAERTVASARTAPVRTCA
ncbi:bifunctional DNA primase/polymerase [Streptomyces sp. OF3]|uniref:Bifunctional DNA primase/polymerase n=1 Tax=Streptomyces alkaliterrae TaxID=2213162 RepID=A0A7W3ZKK4_9ACTN|nr:bifunctional DNA primase/polymerase [Streptomyces alkaliterrae]MBB1251758.1 bifunctional DNA primase/polymerase [Streptomyces alkaliterrae]